MTEMDLQINGLPETLSVRTPDENDVPAVAALMSEYQRLGRGSGVVNEEAISAQTIGMGSWTRRQVLVERAGKAVAFLSVHDRAAGRTVVEPVVAADLDPEIADPLVHCLLDAAQRWALEIGRMRRLRGTLLDGWSYAGDERQRGWLSAAGYEDVRTWWHMSRPVKPVEEQELPLPRAGVTVRRVETHDDGLPVAQDLQILHRLLEESFQDHFSSYRESFPEFVMRLREDPGHRWDHWWLATIEVDGQEMPAGAVVSSVSPADAEGVEGTYIDYIGVHRRARGHGVAKALIYAVISDAAQRGRNRVGLEVDADSPTGANGLYESMGWKTTYVTQSWHKDLDVPR
ncbi:GNAT family N-acetyltransferase [Calidifontibacter terrae]